MSYQELEKALRTSKSPHLNGDRNTYGGVIAKDFETMKITDLKTNTTRIDN